MLFWKTSGFVFATQIAHFADRIRVFVLPQELKGCFRQFHRATCVGFDRPQRVDDAPLVPSRAACKDSSQVCSWHSGSPIHHAHHIISSLPTADHTTVAALRGDQVGRGPPRRRMTGLSPKLWTLRDALKGASHALLPLGEAT